jgi:hypothetical protein
MGVYLVTAHSFSKPVMLCVVLWLGYLRLKKRSQRFKTRGNPPAHNNFFKIKYFSVCPKRIFIDLLQLKEEKAIFLQILRSLSLFSKERH